MSAYGNYKECNGVCICSRCKKIKCNPCMDCIGEHDDLVDEADKKCGSNGYLTECMYFKDMFEENMYCINEKVEVDGKLVPRFEYKGGGLE